METEYKICSRKDKGNFCYGCKHSVVHKKKSLCEESCTDNIRSKCRDASIEERVFARITG
jgi:hypothetical protein